MSRIRATDHPSAVEVKQWRIENATKFGNYSELGSKPWDEISSVEIFPGSRLDAPLLVVPEHWVRAGPSRIASFRTIDPVAALIEGESVSSAQKRDESTRRMLFALWLPRATSRGIWEYAPTSWLTMARLLIRLVRWQAYKRPSKDGSVWMHLDAHDLAKMQADVMRNVGGRKRSAAMIQTLADLGSRGVLADYPIIKRSSANQSSESSNRGFAPDRAVKVIPRNWRPFGDEFVTEFLWRGMWLQRNLASQLIECWSDLIEIDATAAQHGDASKHPKWVEARLNCILKRNWRDCEGRLITQLPFSITYPNRHGQNKSSEWPPNNANAIKYLIAVLQTMNLCMVAFCTGARLSELASATEDSLVGSDTPRFEALTFKLVDDRGGQLRDWPLHPVAAHALKLQADLARKLRPTGTHHLWVMAIRSGLKPRGSELHDLSRSLQPVVVQLGLEHLTGGERAHLHRWRHTIARLVALSIIGSPHVVYDLFGHKDLEMTLRYMLSSPDIMKDVVKVSKETAAALCEEAVVETISGLAAGPAAQPLKDGLEKLRMSRGEEKFEATSLRDLAEILTDSGKRWEVVRPGVICTKAPGQFGPCTQGRGMPDPGSCRTTCDHRLETSRAKAQCDAVIGALVTETKAAIESGLEMLAENLKGQLLANLHRWDDLRDAWIARDAVAASVWEERRRG